METTDLIKEFFAKAEAFGRAIGWGNIDVSGIDGDEITMSREEGCRGSYSREYESVPITWIWLPTAEAVKLWNERQEAFRLARLREAEEGKRRSDEAIEKAERANYQRLKAKYEGSA